MKYNNDDSPLYVFDGNYDDHKQTRVLLDDYEIPPYFKNDLFNLIDEKIRPPYRWFLIGPERSGPCSRQHHSY
jgi:histone arginine demethylase JMJD6